MGQDNTLLWVFGIIGLLLGGSLGALWSPVGDTQTVEVEKPVVVPQEVIKEVPVEVCTDGTYAVDQTLLDEAVADVFDELDDEDSFLTCGNHLFDSDEASIDRFKEWSYTWLDEDEYEVAFTGVFQFEDNSDERDCKDTRTYTVFYEDGEKPEVLL